MTLTGALLAVFIQQWAQSYLQATQGRYSPRDRARIRTFHAEGIDKLRLPLVTKAVPTLIHVSLILFFSGLPIFLFHIDRTVFNVVITWLGLCVAGYACVTLMPIFCQDSPYYSPLSSSAWVCVTSTLFVVYRLFRSLMYLDSPVFRWYHGRYSKSHFRWRSLRGMRKAAERCALQLSSDIDYRALSWMFRTLNEDDEFEQFFDALPGLCDSEALIDPRGAFVKPNEKILSHALIGMMDRTLSSDVIPESVKLRRIIVYTKAIDATSLLGHWWTLRRVLLGDWHGFSRSIQFGLFVQDWKNKSHGVTIFYAQYVVAITIASVRERDDRWFQLASSQLNVSKSLVQNYLANDDSVLLANAIFIVRRAIQTYSGSADHHKSDILVASSRTLASVCQFDIRHTLAEHQHEFCCLWNQLVFIAQKDKYPHVTPLSMVALKSIRRLYITLHEGTSSIQTGFSITTDDGDTVLDDVMSYPMCTIAGHCPSVRVINLQLNEPPPDAAGNVSRATASSTMGIPVISPAVASALPWALPTTPEPLSSAPMPTRLPVPTHRSPSLRPESTLPSLYSTISVPIRYSSWVHSSPHSLSELESRQNSSLNLPPSPFAPDAMTNTELSGLLLRSSTPIPSDLELAPPSRQGTPVIRTIRMSTPNFVPIDSSLASLDLFDMDIPRGRIHAPAPLPGQAILATNGASNTIMSDVRPSTRTPPPAATPSIVQLPPRPATVPLMSVGSRPLPSLPIHRPSVQVTPDNSAPPIVGMDCHPFRRTSPSTRDELISSNDIAASYVHDLTLPNTIVDYTPTASTVSTVSSVSMGSLISASRDTQVECRVPYDDPEPSVLISEHFEYSISPAPSLLGAGPATSAPPSPVIPPTRLTPMRTPQTLKFNENGEFSGLLYYSPHNVAYQDDLYPTALHLFEARKFVDHRPDLAERIRLCEGIEEVTAVSAKFAEFMRRDWNNVALTIVCTGFFEYRTILAD